MSDRVLLISDLHLEAQKPEITAALKQFLLSNLGQCKALYILGDLFEVWIGDDVESPLSIEVAAALKEFSDAGSDVFIMHGNRDFLLGDCYARRCCAEIIQEPYVLNAGGIEALLLHGDTLCTDDVDYQTFRNMVRDPGWQSEFLGKTIEERIAYAREARQQSQKATENKSMAIMDVNNQAVEALFSDSNQSIVIHGHTHRPLIHEVTLNSSDATESIGKRIVLGDWDTQLWYVEIQNGTVELHCAPFTASN